MRLPDGTELTYCTNIHPGESWHEVQQSLNSYTLKVKASVAGRAPFGIGLRLSASAAAELSVAGTLEEFKLWLTLNNCYVFTINGFPYGNFHGESVKQNVYLPDWRSRERVDYTLNLAELLVTLLPEGYAGYGSISTVPLGFKASFSESENAAQAAENLLLVACQLIELENKSGKRIILGLEPEPCCYLETIRETVRFFNDYLLSASASEKIGNAFNLSAQQARLEIRKHIGICLDLCHAAVEFEDPHDVIEQIQSANINIAKIQITNCLRIPSVNNQKIEQLSAFADEIYLHQVVEKTEQGLHRYADIPQAISRFYSNPIHGDIEWRVHFHIPVFLNMLSIFDTTQSFTEAALAGHVRTRLTRHLEIETYTWCVLPEQYRPENVVELIRKEYSWVNNILLP
ncbi:MAG: metabolite traffic protein EboE [Nitrosomonas sp.]|nr:metabolite traffic protein EboE [Nitrosomonas sp.]